MEWRALTVCLLDEIATALRKKLGKTEKEFPLVKVCTHQQRWRRSRFEVWMATGLLGGTVSWRRPVGLLTSSTHPSGIPYRMVHAAFCGGSVVLPKSLQSLQTSG